MKLLLSVVGLALTTLRENKVRSFLTVLGVIIGVGTIVGVGSILAGPAAAFLKQQTGSWTAVFIVVAVLDAVTAFLAIAVLKPMRAKHLATA